MEEKSELGNLVEHFKEYITSRVNHFLLSSAEKTFRLVAIIISNSIVLIFLLFFLLFASIAVALLLSDYYDKTYLGFLAVGIAYFILGMMMVLFKKKWMEEKIITLFIKQFFAEEEE